MEKTIVLYPGLSVSHFVPMMQLADALLAQGYAVAVALIDITLDHDAALAAAVSAAAADAKPSVTFHTLPRIKNPPTFTGGGVDFLLGYFEMVRRYNEHLREFLLSSTTPPRRVHAVVVDALSMEALDVTRELGVPGYTFYATNASALAVFVQLPSIRTEGQPRPSFREMGDTPLGFRGVSPMPASHLFAELLEDPESEIYKTMMSLMGWNTDADGILVNTFASLETRAVGALRDPHILPPSSPGGGERRMMPPVYCVGPLVAGATGSEAEDNKHECLGWLDAQPERSVVFLCFGSIGAATHSPAQLREIAAGLERSGHRFLWVVRAPILTDPARPSPCEPDLDALLPDGFLERTRDRGLVVKHWVPQVAVLRHRATGAFVTHCGWNSVLEGITAGVPMLCWPLHSEQKMNKVFMVEEAGIGVEMVGWKQGMVEAEEVEAKVRLVMESEDGERLRARVAAHKDAAGMAWKDDGGSSRAAFAQFLSNVDSLGTPCRNGKLG